MSRNMGFKRIRFLSLAVVIGLAALCLALELLWGNSVVLAHESQEQERAEYFNLVPEIQAPPQVVHTIYYTDPGFHVVLNLAGNPVGEGVHVGEVSCRDENCNKKTQLELLVGSERISFEYQFKTLQALDPEARRSVVAGRGTLHNGVRRERFLFTATFEDNRDGTVSVTYVASRPDASFIIPGLPGRFEITSRP